MLVIFEILIYFSKRCHKFANLVIIINKVDSYTHARAPRASFQNFSKLWDYIGDKYHALLGCLCCKFSMGHVTWSDHGFSSARGKTLGTSLIFSAFYHFLRSHISVSPQVRIRVLSKSFNCPTGPLCPQKPEHLSCAWPGWQSENGDKNRIVFLFKFW